jgi:DNA-binding NarL/FixJ family response regulator
VLLMDVRMPVLDGIDATRRIAGEEATQAVRVIVLTTFDLDDYVYRALRAGASGFLLKDTSPESAARRDPGRRGRRRPARSAGDPAADRRVRRPPDP